MKNQPNILKFGQNKGKISFMLGQSRLKFWKVSQSKTDQIVPWCTATHRTCDRKIEVWCNDGFGQIASFSAVMKMEQNHTKLTVNTPTQCISIIEIVSYLI